jgi:hypothetical protein
MDVREYELKQAITKDAKEKTLLTYLFHPSKNLRT